MTPELLKSEATTRDAQSGLSPAPLFGRRRKSPTDLCVIASELSPNEWPEEILWPLYKQPVSIFGYNQVAMARNLTRTLVEALVWTERCESNSAARRMIQSNAVMVNRMKVKDVNRILTAADALPNLGAIVIEAGKYNFAIIELCDAVEWPNE